MLRTSVSFSLAEAVGFDDLLLCVFFESFYTTVCVRVMWDCESMCVWDFVSILRACLRARGRHVLECSSIGHFLNDVALFLAPIPCGRCLIDVLVASK